MLLRRRKSEGFINDPGKDKEKVPLGNITDVRGRKSCRQAKPLKCLAYRGPPSTNFWPRQRRLYLKNLTKASKKK